MKVVKRQIQYYEWIPAALVALIGMTSAEERLDAERRSTVSTAIPGTWQRSSHPLQGMSADAAEQWVVVDDTDSQQFKASLDAVTWEQRRLDPRGPGPRC